MPYQWVLILPRHVLTDCRFNCHKKCVDRVPNECLGQPAAGNTLSETGSECGDALLDNDISLDAMSLDEEREDKENDVTTPDDETTPKPSLRYVKSRTFSHLSGEARA